MPSVFYITQPNDITYWSPEYHNFVKSRDLKGIGSIITSKLKEASIDIVNEYLVLDGSEYRIVLRIDSRRTPKSVANILEMSPRYVNSLPRGRYSYDSALAKLINYKDLDKSLLNPDDVVTMIGEDYKSVYDNRHEKWELSRKRLSEKAMDNLLADYSDYDINDLLVGIHHHRITDSIINGDPYLRSLKDLYYDAVIKALAYEGMDYEEDPEVNDWKGKLDNMLKELIVSKE